jgi:hypothetical protein
MGSPLYPILVNFYMESFEQQAISSVAKRSTHWYRCGYNTIVVWIHGKEELQDFLEHLNSVHTNIKVIVEVEQNKTLYFLSVLVSRRPDILYTVKPPRSIVQFLWPLNKSYLNYGNKTRTSHSLIYHFPASVGQNF